ncbi:MAG TPA: ImmA/IrrE family metallo-endopeptidase [Clostridiales bacterium]|nr:ImmA/IrrE family metallo-endopeptidase [Clostridiales bacterium]
MNDLFYQAFIEKYSQERYDFSINALEPDEVNQVKSLAQEKRHEFGIAPIGTDIFRFIRDKENNIYFEKESFDNNDLDAMLYLPDPNKDNAYIILNSSQPLINQIFATAHEYYHYIKDLEYVRKNPKVCSLSSLKDKSEQKASRFAAEFLLPESSLRKSIERWLLLIKKRNFGDAEFNEVAALCYCLTVQYCMPLKAVMFRIYEEGYIDDISVYLSNYNFIKQTLKESKTQFAKRIQELMATENPYIYEVMYRLIPKAYNTGYVSLDKVESDVSQLGLVMDNMMEFLDIKDCEDEEEIDDSLRESLLIKLSEMGQ